MKVVIAGVQVPFVRGGGELMMENLVSAFREAGHQTELVMMPFRFGPPAAVHRSMAAWKQEEFESLGLGEQDLFLPLKFPAFYAQHPNKVCWLMHQHRSVYELWGTANGPIISDPAETELKAEIEAQDTLCLAAAKKVFTISDRVSERLMEHNGIASEPLLQPPPNADQYFCDEQLPYILVPSRLESLKRQDLAIRALATSGSNVRIVIVGTGGQAGALAALAQSLGVEDRVLFTGEVSRRELIAWYANALAVFFAPFDEDYGFVTLEAMLSAKPVVTCIDSGGPLSFVIDEKTGFICNPDPDDIASAFDRLWSDHSWAKKIGGQAREHYATLNLSWAHVVSRLTDAAGV